MADTGHPLHPSIAYPGRRPVGRDVRLEATRRPVLSFSAGSIKRHAEPALAFPPSS